LRRALAKHRMRQRPNGPQGHNTTCSCPSSHTCQSNASDNHLPFRHNARRLSRGPHISVDASALPSRHPHSLCECLWRRSNRSNSPRRGKEFTTIHGILLTVFEYRVRTAPLCERRKSLRCNLDEQTQSRRLAEFCCGGGVIPRRAAAPRKSTPIASKSVGAFHTDGFDQPSPYLWWHCRQRQIHQI
jgi:hypothetical protein